MRKMNKLAAVLAIGLMMTGCNSYESLFDGKNLDGWKCDPAECLTDWKVENGELVGENATENASILWTNRQFRDFELELDYIPLTDDYDSGIFIRGLTHQVQIGISRSLEKDMTACIYAPEDDLGSYPGQTDKVAEIYRDKKWNHMKVIVRGKEIQTILNGEPMVDYIGIVLAEEGPIGLQLHGGVHMAVKFRNIKVREL